MSGTLYVVATPLGNLEDLTTRAIRILRESDLIACEDTRHTRNLLNHIGSVAATLSYHEHNEASRAVDLLNRLREGKSIALVSDAGTPLVSDPGYRLVSLARAAALPVVPIPGPSALTAAVSVSGLPTDRILFLGFLPKRAGLRRRQLREARHLRATLVLYVAPHQILSLLRDASEMLGERRAFLIREMTKVFETAYFGTLGEIRQQVEATPPKGEYTLVVEPCSADPRQNARDQQEKELPIGDSPLDPHKFDLEAYLCGLMEIRKFSRRDAVRVAAAHLGLSKKEIYSLFTRDKSRKR